MNDKPQVEFRKVETARLPQWDAFVNGERVGYVGTVTGACNRPTGRFSWNVTYKHIGWKTAATPQAAAAALKKELRKDGKVA